MVENQFVAVNTGMTKETGYSNNEGEFENESCTKF
jgi:hypothetical protein